MIFLLKEVIMKVHVVHHPKNKPELIIEESIYCPETTFFIITEDGFNLKAVNEFEVLVYPKWIIFILSMFFIYGTKIDYKGYRI